MDIQKLKNYLQQSNGFSLLDCEIRPVTKFDKWCQRKMPKGQIPVGDAPWGYVVTIPYCPNENTFLDNVDGYIVRTKKHCGNLLFYHYDYLFHLFLLVLIFHFLR